MTDTQRQAIIDIMTWLGQGERWIEEVASASIFATSIHSDTVRAYMEEHKSCTWDKNTQATVVRFLEWCDGGDCLHRGPYNPYGEYIRLNYYGYPTATAYATELVEDYERDSIPAVVE